MAAVFRTADRFALDVAVDLAVVFFAGDFLAVDFLAVDFFAGDFFAGDFLAVAFLTGDLLAVVFAFFPGVLPEDVARFVPAFAAALFLRVAGRPVVVGSPARAFLRVVATAFALPFVKFLIAVTRCFSVAMLVSSRSRCLRGCYPATTTGRDRLLPHSPRW
ncbi:MAG: hypothetical protein NVSMB21_19680 [Vulcanimicrobiaceae bacterium]